MTLSNSILGGLALVSTAAIFTTQGASEPVKSAPEYFVTALHSGCFECEKERDGAVVRCDNIFYAEQLFEFFFKLCDKRSFVHVIVVEGTFHETVVFFFDMRLPPRDLFLHDYDLVINDTRGRERHDELALVAELAVDAHQFFSDVP